SLPPQVTEALSSYVKKGAAVLCSAKVPARDQAFLNLLGLGSVGPETEAYGAYFRCPDEKVVPVGDSCLKCSLSTASPLFPVMPAQKFGPPEVCYVQEECTESFGMYLNEFGGGRAIFIPWKAGSLYYSEGYDIWFEFMKGVLTRYAGACGIGVDLSPMVEVTLGRSGDSTLVCLVNGSGHFGNSFFSPVTIRDAVVEIPWQGDFSMKSLVCKDNCSGELINGKLRITVKELGFFEEIVIDK
ncbi:MAG: hypothetical protein K5634_02195, partial [Sphaerochaetaceae bacterium]|nr:hypothetical protein [Sphaerochaetaceae bacterium]